MTRRPWWLAASAVVCLAAQSPRIPVSTDQRIAAIERRLQRTPADPALRNELAGAFLQKMRETADGSYLERADRIVAAMLKIDSANYDARRRRLEIEMQRHRFRQAAALGTSLVQERATDSAVWGMLGDAAMETGDYDRAADAYQAMADIRPDLASYNRVAFYRFVTGDAAGAIDLMRRAVRAGSAEKESVAWCLAELGRMLLKTGAIEEAEQAFGQALAEFPGYHPALAGQGRALASRRRYQEAIKPLLAAQAVVPLAEYTGLLAKLYRKTAEPELARRQIALLDVTDKLDQATGETANRSLSLALSDLDHRPARALELARAELNIRQDVYTYDALAWALYRNGKLEEACAAIRRALSQNSPEPSFHDHAARIFEAAGPAEEAELHRAKPRAAYW